MLKSKIEEEWKNLNIKGRCNMSKHQNKSGVSAWGIRILIIVLVFGALLAMAVPNFVAYRKRGYSSGANSDHRNAYTAARSYFSDDGDQSAWVPSMPPTPAPGPATPEIHTPTSSNPSRVQRYQERQAARQMNTEAYDRIYESGFKTVSDHPLSTFSIDVDTASYSNVRRFINQRRMPPEDAVRIEEMINYFTYDYPQPRGEHPFAIYAEISQCPWNRRNRLVHIGLQGKRPDADDLRPANLVFLIDTSGSMSPGNKLPLLVRSFDLLLRQLGGRDRVAIVTYAGSAGLVLNSTPADHVGKYRIQTALKRLRAGGSTAGGAGIELAYRVAMENFIPGGNNRVILATDGDFNVGVSSTSKLVRIIEEKREDDIFLTICGFGMGNYKDGKMERISNAGNGNYFYIDNAREAEKVFATEMRANLLTIAKDVKIQIEFNPAKVAAYRLVGYENRLMAAEDFHDDTKDAGELGAGHTVTALYEIEPAGYGWGRTRRVDPLRYQEKSIRPEASHGDEILLVKFRYKDPHADVSRLLESPVLDQRIPLYRTSNNFRFSAAVAGFGMLLRRSAYTGDLTWNQVMDLAQGAMGDDMDGLRGEFLSLVETCARITG